MAVHRTACVGLAVLLLIGSSATGADVAREDFNTDPSWDALNNRMLPENLPVTKQSFGWRDTNHAGGKAKGEIGGYVQRSATAAYFGVPIKPRTLDDKLHVGGRFAVTRDDGSSGVMFGWFNQNSRGWRTPNSLAMRVDGNGAGRGYILFYEYGTQHYLAGGGGAFEGPRYQTTRTKFFQPDGASHTFALDYDPAGAGGNGLITFTLDGDRKYEVPLDAGHKADGAIFDRFGIWNAQTTGGGMEIYFDDVEVGGEHLDFTAADPNWAGLGNEVEFKDRVRRPFQDFGFSPTNRAGGRSPGEFGGVIWRDDKPAYYGADVGRLSLDDELVASGTVAFTGQGSDSGVWLGWFDAADKRSRTKAESEQRPKNFLGILIEGPSRIGHYFRQGYRASNADGRIADTGPVIHPNGKVHRWSMRYDPRANNGVGRIDLTFDDEKLSLDLRPEDRKAGATFDRFGLFNVQEGGHYVEVYVDDLMCTSGRGR